MKSPKLILIALSALLLTACTFNATYKNREFDKNEAEQVTNKLFSDLQNKNYDASYSLYSKDFWDVTSKAKLIDLYNYAQGRLGDLKDTNLAEWQTTTITGTNPSADYEFRYKNTYQNGEASVSIRLIKDPDHKVRIIALRFNSDAFLAK